MTGWIHASTLRKEFNLTHLLALWSSTVDASGGGRFHRRIDDGGGAAEAAFAREPGGVIVGVQSHEEGARRRADLNPDNVSRILGDLPAGGNGDDGAAGNEAGKKLEASLVVGLKLKHSLLPGKRSGGLEGRAWAKDVEHFEVRPLVLSLTVRVQG